MPESLSIGQVAKQTGIGIEAIRFYERERLIETPSRTDSGYRQFTQSHIKRLLFIQQGKSLGFSLTEIKELLSIREDPDSGSHEIKALALAKLQNIETKIRMLQGMKKTLKRLVDSCPGQGPKQDCPILEALDTKQMELE